MRMEGCRDRARRGCTCNSRRGAEGVSRLSPRSSRAGESCLVGSTIRARRLTPLLEVLCAVNLPRTISQARGVMAPKQAPADSHQDGEIVHASWRHGDAVNKVAVPEGAAGSPPF